MAGSVYVPEMIKKINMETGEEEIFYSFIYEGVPDEFKRYAEEKLNETAENKRKGIQELRKFLERESISCSDDDLIVVTLRNCKYDIQKSQKKLKRFLKLRQRIAEKLLELDRKKFELVLDDMFGCILPFRDKNGRTLLTARASASLDIRENADDIIICVLATLLFTLSFPMTSICGFSHIGELKSDTLYRLYALFETSIRHISVVLDYPIQFKRVHFLNENFLFRWCLKILRPILPQKLIERVITHGPNYQDMIKFYHPDIIPNHLGGNLGPLSNTFYRQRLLDFLESLKNEFRQK